MKLYHVKLPFKLFASILCATIFELYPIFRNNQYIIALICAIFGNLPAGLSSTSRVMMVLKPSIHTSWPARLSGLNRSSFCCLSESFNSAQSACTADQISAPCRSSSPRIAGTSTFPVFAFIAAATPAPCPVAKHVPITLEAAIA